MVKVINLSNLTGWEKQIPSRVELVKAVEEADLGLRITAVDALNGRFMATDRVPNDVVRGIYNEFCSKFTLSAASYKQFYLHPADETLELVSFKTKLQHVWAMIADWLTKLRIAFDPIITISLWARPLVDKGKDTAKIEADIFEFRGGLSELDLSYKHWKLPLSVMTGAVSSSHLILYSGLGLPKLKNDVVASEEVKEKEASTEVIVTGD